jgi:hypothetical protein
MAGYGIFNEVDIDGRHWKFAQQQKGMSCGPTSVKIAKELFHNQSVGEEMIRGSVGMQYAGTANTGVSLAQAAQDSANRWDADGSIENKVLPAVKLSPLPIPKAHFAKGAASLRAATRNHPAILGFNWDGGGGHFVVCVGNTKKNPSLFVILDPDGGLQYLDANDAVGDVLKYKPTYGSTGDIDPIGFIIT